MNTFNNIGITSGNAICYSGYRDGQHPGGVSPSYAEVKEDLTILQKHWKYLRLFDCDQHSQMVLEVIKKEGFDLKIMLGAYIVAEENNFNCPWQGGVYTPPQLEKNRIINQDKIDRLIEMGNLYPEVIFSLSVGNETCVNWTDHYVPEYKVLQYVNQVKAGAKQPVTFCDNYAPWLGKLKKVAEAVDFISIHTYPVWEYKQISEALSYTQQNYYSVADEYPHKPVVITEAGWTTRSNGKGIEPSFVNEELQKRYIEDLIQWVTKENILTFFFEAFDEYWKGADEPLEPEKHWGLFNIDRTPKLAVKHLFKY
ncbi:glycosyl hydrolase [Gracilimonas sp. Q87]|uniref:glycosyl hydrolase n=1 Tax=Gracilimonas sp. Q87 TaxID=3384766 RepID=UPI003983E4BF